MLKPVECDQIMGVVSQMADPSTHLENYVLPGLASTLLPKGKLRMFTASRYTEEFINPHSHRFDFACLVLRGQVWNTIYKQTQSLTNAANPWTVWEVTPVDGGLGTYKQQLLSKFSFYETQTSCHVAGQAYSMLDKDIHSIRFSRDAVVLFIEGPPRKDHSLVLEPLNGFPDKVNTVPTFKPQPWMFQKAAN